MADIDKTLPNVRQTTTIPGPQQEAEIVSQMQETVPTHQDTEITENIRGALPAIDVQEK